MDLGLNGRVALVLGASSGLGLASAEALTGEGAAVVMVARGEERLQRHAERLGAHALIGDVSKPGDLEHAVSATVSEYGGLDIVITNGGGPPPGPALSAAGDSIDQAVSLLLKPVVALANAALPHLRKSGRGRIVSISSVSVREPIRNLALSNAVRPGVWGYLKSLAAEVARDGITVNSVAPGRIATPRTKELYGGDPPQTELDAIPLGRFGQPRELGAVVCFLCSEQASYVTGALIPVDGGLMRSL